MYTNMVKFCLVTWLTLFDSSNLYLVYQSFNIYNMIVYNLLISLFILQYKRFFVIDFIKRFKKNLLLLHLVIFESRKEWANKKSILSFK